MTQEEQQVKEIVDLIHEALTRPCAFTPKGYAVIYAPQCPFASAGGQIARARYVAWLVGELTEKSQVVHHRDGNPGNDIPDNLVVISKQAHVDHHRASDQTRQRRQLGQIHRQEDEEARAESLAIAEEQATGRISAQEAKRLMHNARNRRYKSNNWNRIDRQDPIEHPVVVAHHKEKMRKWHETRWEDPQWVAQHKANVEQGRNIPPEQKEAWAKEKRRRYMAARRAEAREVLKKAGVSDGKTNTEGQ